jgi:hypothetical protein
MFKIAAKAGDVTLRRGADKLFVLVAKGRWAFITQTEPGARCVQVFTEHHTARFLEPDLFMKLKRAYRRDGLEVWITISFGDSLELINAGRELPGKRCDR